MGAFPAPIPEVLSKSWNFTEGYAEAKEGADPVAKVTRPEIARGGIPWSLCEVAQALRGWEVRPPPPTPHLRHTPGRGLVAGGGCPGGLLPAPSRVQRRGPGPCKPCSARPDALGAGEWGGHKRRPGWLQPADPGAVKPARPRLECGRILEGFSGGSGLIASLGPPGSKGNPPTFPPSAQPSCSSRLPHPHPILSFQKLPGSRVCRRPLLCDAHAVWPPPHPHLSHRGPRGASLPSVVK